MRSWMMILITAMILAGCSHTGVKRNIKGLERLHTGDSHAAVVDRLGPPDMEVEVSAARTIAYYQTEEKPSADGPVTRELCTPVAFEDGKVIAVGGDLPERWLHEAAERERRARIEARRREAARAAELARQRVETARLEKIAELEKTVRPIPASNAALNLKLYRQLLDLDPENPKYRTKVSYYEARLTEQKERREARASQTEIERMRQAWEKSRPARNERLRQYTGNGIAEMAVHDMGDGSLYVWVKNVSGQIITTHPDYFTLLDTDDQPMVCEISDSLDSVLEPGSLSHGKIIYSDAIIPKMLIFQNREAGRIGKPFQ